MMKIGILILLCCVAATSCYSVADFAEKLAEKIVAKRDAKLRAALVQKFTEKEDEYVLKKMEDEATSESEEPSVKEVEVDEPVIESDQIDTDLSVFDMTASKEFDEIVGTPVQAVPEYVPEDDSEADAEAMFDESVVSPAKGLADLKKVLNKVGEFNTVEKSQIAVLATALGSLKKGMIEVLESNIIRQLSKENYVSMISDLMRSVLTDEQKFDLIADGLVRLDQSKRLEILAVLDEELLKENPEGNKEAAAALKTEIVDYLVANPKV